MLRFCDREICCIEYDCLNREELREYFLSGHLNDMIFVYDDCSKWKGYRGKITFHSLAKYADIYDALSQEYLILDENIWKNGRDYFKYNENLREEGAVIPVLDQDGRLICFAYQDITADRQLRMLRELDEVLDAPDFKALYPEYDCVTIYGCNELAYVFAEYLRKRDIPVNLVGNIWDCFGNGMIDQRWQEVLEYRNFKIYAEGISQTSKELLPDVLRSAAPEFECIDQIYEAAIYNGMIQDAEGDIEWLLEKLRNETEIVILGTGIESQNAYDYLLGCGIEARCFMSESLGYGRLLGKNILPEIEIKKQYKHAVLFDCETEYSAWGFGETDRYDCEGYQRNKRFFCLKDYIKLPVSCLPNTLRGKHIILAGNFYLCRNLERILKELEGLSIAYWDVLNENSEKNSGIRKASREEAVNADICLLVEPPYFGPGVKRNKPVYMRKLQERGMANVTDYFSDSRVFMGIQKKDEKKYTLSCLTPGRILFGESGHMCGNSLLIHLWDGHPNVLFMEYYFLRNNLYFICMQLAEEKAENIPTVFWEIYEKTAGESYKIPEKDKIIFDKTFAELLAYQESYTSQELFVILHIVCAETCGGGMANLYRMH